MGKTLAELHAMLKLYEKGILKKAETPDVLAIREGKIQKEQREVGHWRRNYPSYHADLKRRKNASEASISVVMDIINKKRMVMLQSDCTPSVESMGMEVLLKAGGRS
ncbi:hypothetical protein Tco_0644719 [Tanacetum coccineum]